MLLARHRPVFTLACVQAQCRTVLCGVDSDCPPPHLGMCQKRKLNISTTFDQHNKPLEVELKPNLTSDSHDAELEGKGRDIPFAHARLGQFAQEEPRLRNQFSQDAFLQGFLQRHVPDKHLSKMRGKLEKLGDRVAGDIYQLSLRMEAEPPKLEQMDAWGRRVDRLVTSTAWQDMKAISAQEGLIASGYDREFSEWSRLYQMAQFYLFEPSGGLYGCPLAMTNGAARTVECRDIPPTRKRLHEAKDMYALFHELLQNRHSWLYDEVFPRLISRDPQKFWTSGQWMTEKRGGSDVAGGTETVAVEQADGTYKLYGYKWFSSATDADMTLTLARVVDSSGNTVKGTRGLSLFYLDVKGQGSSIQLVKLKNKLGTRQLPTAELLIEGATAHRISEEGRGVASMSQMLTLTRIHTAVHAAAAMRRIVNLARDYASRRRAFGQLLLDHPLHMHTLASMEVQTRAAAIFVFELSRLLGRQETLVEPDEKLEREKNVLRLAVPLLKLYVSKQSVSVVSEGLECFGGQGYIEDTGLPRILRDTQVTPIWEGTTNILSLDVLRAIRKSAAESSSSYDLSGTSVPPVLHHFQQDILDRISPGKELAHLQPSAEKLEAALAQVLKSWICLQPHQQDMAAREMAFSLASIYMGGLLVEHAAHPLATAADTYTAQRWCEGDMAPLCRRAGAGRFSSTAQDLNLEMVFDGFSHSD